MDDNIRQIIATKILLGDNSQYLFLKWLLGNKFNNKFNNQPVLLKYGNQYNISYENECWVIITNKLLPNEIVFVADESCDISALPAASETKFFIFEEFPFQKESINTLIYKLKSVYVDNCFIAVILNEKFEYASTDIDNPQKALQTAEIHYRQYLGNVIVISNEDDIYSILGYISTYQNIIKNKAAFSLMYYKFLANNLEKFYKMEIIVGFWEAYSYKFNVDICSFNSIDIDKKKPYISIWDMYAKAAERKLFDIKNGIFSKKITEFYKDKLSKINIIIWNIDKDADILLSVLKQEFILAANNSNYGKKYRGKRVIVTNKYEYNILIGKKDCSNSCYGINADFSNFVDDFINKKCLEILVKRMKIQYQRLEDILNE